MSVAVEAPALPVHCKASIAEDIVIALRAPATPERSDGVACVVDTAVFVYVVKLFYRKKRKEGGVLCIAGMEPALSPAST